jgi:leucine dehydrogenase
MPLDSLDLTPLDLTGLDLGPGVPTDHERVVRARDPRAGLDAVIAIHDTRRGPSLGGVRAFPYASDDDALRDALRLSAAMTRKAAAADLPLGGGKAVLRLPRGHALTDGLLLAFGHAIDALDGAYITTEDVGTSEHAMAVIRRATPHVTGRPVEQGGRGDPGRFTARGVFHAARATWHHLTGHDTLADARCLVQGLGHVGMSLAERLHRDGAALRVSDLDEARVAEAVERFAATPVAIDAVLTTPTDLLMPCAMGGLLTHDAVPTLACRAVVGAANNQLATDDVADRLAAAGVLYVPDHMANAGGLISVAAEPLGMTDDEVDRRIAAIGPRVAERLATADVGRA